MRSEPHEALSPKFVTRYLEATGWRRTAGNEKQSLYIYPFSDGENLELIVARSEQVRGWESSVRDALETLSGLHGTSIDEMTLVVRSIIFDIVQSTLPNELVRDDTIDLDVASEYIWRSKRLLEVSATAEMVKAQSFKKIRKEAKIYAGSCRFGHTFHGSFGFTLESPLSETEQQTAGGIPPQVPFERRVIERLARGLLVADEATKAKNPERLASSYETGWNANVCDEIVKLFGAAKQTQVSFNFLWSKEFKPSEDVGSSQRFTLSRQKVEIIQEAANILRTRSAEQQEQVIGWVVELKSERLPGSLVSSDGEIVVRWQSEEMGNIKVHINLPLDDYRLAIQAHEHGQMIVAHGTLEKIGRSWHLKNLNSFGIHR